MSEKVACGLGHQAAQRRYTCPVENRCQRHDGIQRQQARRGAGNSFARPLALGFDAPMGTRFL